MIQQFAGEAGLLLNGIAVGATWIVAIVSPNTSYDRLDAGRADGYVRDLLKRSCAPISGLFLAACAFYVLSTHIGAASLSGLAAFGMLTNRWTLASVKRNSRPPGVRHRRKSQRVVAISLTLLFGVVGFVAALLGIFGV